VGVRLSPLAFIFLVKFYYFPLKRNDKRVCSVNTYI
jgi:hypothetical protein